jgi:NAD(P)H-dependent FMN reductase
MTSEIPNEAPLRTAVLIGSNRVGRFADTVAGWLVPGLAGYPELDVDVIDVAELVLPVRYGQESDPASLAQYRRRLDQAEAFVVVTPEYNHSFPASLKQAIDVVGSEWRAKPLGFVSYGGMSGGLRAVEQLRLVFAELHVVTMRDVVSIHGLGARFDQGVPVDPDGMALALKTLVDHLVWWGLTLRAGRAGRPY